MYKGFDFCVQKEEINQMLPPLDFKIAGSNIKTISPIVQIITIMVQEITIGQH